MFRCGAPGWRIALWALAVSCGPSNADVHGVLDEVRSALLVIEQHPGDGWRGAIDDIAHNRVFSPPQSAPPCPFSIASTLAAETDLAKQTAAWTVARRTHPKAILRALGLTILPPGASVSLAAPAAVDYGFRAVRALGERTFAGARDNRARIEAAHRLTVRTTWPPELIVVTRLEQPAETTSETTFAGGYIAGTAFLFDHRNDRIACSGSFISQSSKKVTTLPVDGRRIDPQKLVDADLILAAAKAARRGLRAQPASTSR